MQRSLLLTFAIFFLSLRGWALGYQLDHERRSWDDQDTLYERYPAVNSLRHHLREQILGEVLASRDLSHFSTRDLIEELDARADTWTIANTVKKVANVWKKKKDGGSGSDSEGDKNKKPNDPKKAGYVKLPPFECKVCSTEHMTKEAYNDCKLRCNAKQAGLI